MKIQLFFRINTCSLDGCVVRISECCVSFGQTRKKDDNIKEVDTVAREDDIKANHEAPATEIVRLEETEPQNTDFSEEVERLF